MFKQSLALNLKIGAKYGVPAIAFALTCSVIAVIFYFINLGITLLAFALSAVVGLICMVKTLNLLLDTSIFNEGSSFYMTLPLSEEAVVTGKLCASGIYITSLQLISLLSLNVLWLLAQISGEENLPFEEMLGTYTKNGISPLSEGLSAMLTPLVNALLSFLFCALLLFAILIQRIGGFKKFVNIILSWIFAMIICGLLPYFQILLGDFLANRGIMPALGLLITALLWAVLSFLLIRSSVRMLKTQYSQQPA